MAVVDRRFDFLFRNTQAVDKLSARWGNIDFDHGQSPWVRPAYVSVPMVS
jgi:hypothetical protein